MEEDVASAAHALNDRGAGLDFELSVVGADELEDGLVSPKVRDTLMGKKADFSDKSDAPRLGMCGCLTLAYYQPYFDVDTADIQVRLSRALLPFKKEPRFAELALTAPDAYGPFWLSTTLVFCLASCSNAASFLDYTGDASEWAYDFSRLASALTLVEVFLVGLPVLVWLVGKYLKIPMTLLFLMCLYGYSVAIFIPASIACVIPLDAVDWVGLLLAMAWSLYFVLSNLWTVISEHLSKEKMLPVLALISATHLVWAALMKLLFF